MARLSTSKLISFVGFCAFTLALNPWGDSALAKDPFRMNNARQIGDKTEEAFKELFEKGNYKKAQLHLIAAESSEEKEPLAHALRASLAYTDKDWDTLNTYAQKTLQTAEELESQDPLRGNLYLAVGHFLEGTYIYEKEGPIGAIAKLQKVFEHLDLAEAQDAKDPEFNLLKGYMDLMLAVNLPFSNTSGAIERLKNYGAPDYLVERGIAVAYRDLNKYDQALDFVEQALQRTPENPELYYLKGQILREKSNQQNDSSLLKEAIAFFEKALQKAEQFPASILKQLKREHQKAQKRLDELESADSPVFKYIL
jgi:tetratricopeptide (TPR) repeat protein